MSGPSVSVITAHSPGRADFLQEAYQSLLEQKEENWQWLIEGEKGCIHPAKILKDRRVFYRENPKGLAVAIKRNNALLEAKAEYICILDDDDILPPDSLSTRLEVLAKHPEAGFLMTDAGILNDPDFQAENPPFAEGLLDKGEFYHAWKKRKADAIPGVIPMPNAVLWRRAALWRIAGWHALRKGEDTAMMVHACLLYASVYLRKTTYLLREHEGRLTHDKSRVKETIAWINKMAEAIIKEQKKSA